jgi:hypothetical protein
MQTLQNLEQVSRRLTDSQIEYFVRYPQGRTIIKIVADWDGHFNLLKSILDENGIGYKTGEDTTGYLIIIEVE